MAQSRGDGANTAGSAPGSGAVAGRAASADRDGAPARRLAGLRIAIVGAGTAGLATALYLHRAGHDVSVFERFAAARPVGSGLMLQPTGLTVLHDLGLAGAVLARGARIERLSGCDAMSGRRVLDVAYRGGRFGLGVHRAALFEVLFTAVQRAGIAVKTGAEITSVAATTQGAMPVDRHGPVDNKPFDFVIDAAGAQSMLRDASQPGARQIPLTYGAFWTTVPWPDDGRFAETALQQRYDHAHVMIGVLPIGQVTPSGLRQAAFFWSLKRSDVAAVKAAGLAAWKERVAALWPETAVLLEHIRSFDDLALAKYGHHTLAAPFRGRVIHLGDSAHATSPQLGQGANMALLDAAALDCALRSTVSLDEVGPAYARMRRAHVRFFQAASYVLTPFYQSDSRLIPFARDTLVATVARVPPMPAILAALVSGTLVNPFAPIGLSEVREWPVVEVGDGGAAASELHGRVFHGPRAKPAD